jgi:hypothetical protein
MRSGLMSGRVFSALVDRVGVPDRVLERARAVVIVLRCTALDLILNAFDAARPPGRLLGNKGAAEAVIATQVVRDVAELGRKVLVDEDDVHASPLGMKNDERMTKHEARRASSPLLRGRDRGWRCLAGPQG